MPAGNETYLGNILTTVPDKNTEGTDTLDNYHRELRRTMKNTVHKGVFGEHYSDGKHKFPVEDAQQRSIRLEPLGGQLSFDRSTGRVYRYDSVSETWVLLRLEHGYTINMLTEPGGAANGILANYVFAHTSIYLKAGIYSLTATLFCRDHLYSPATYPAGQTVKFHAGGNNVSAVIPAVDTGVAFAALTYTQPADGWVDLKFTVTLTLAGHAVRFTKGHVLVVRP